MTQQDVLYGLCNSRDSVPSTKIVIPITLFDTLLHTLWLCHCTTHNSHHTFSPIAACKRFLAEFLSTCTVLYHIATSHNSLPAFWSTFSPLVLYSSSHLSWHPHLFSSLLM